VTTVLGALAGGVVGTAVLTSGLRLAQEARLTRMDIAFLLGTALSERRDRAQLLGYVLHGASGLVFALVYGLIFVATDAAGWLFGGLLGLVHGLVAGGVLINVLLPAVHPRMGRPWTDAQETPLLEPPGFMLVNYGPATGAVALLLHVVYGAIVGGFAAGF
jgi:hypothetical protein